MENDSILKSRITLSHIALTRGWVNGLDLVAMADRYLAALGDADGGKVDLRIVKTTLNRVLGELVTAAFRNGIKGAGVLLRQAKFIKCDEKRPTLDEYRATLHDGDFFGEDEITALYLDEYAQDDKTSKSQERAIKRRHRLVARQIELLHTLEQFITAPLQWPDSVQSWFSRDTASLLADGGIETVAALVEAIVSRPDDWFSDIKSIGQGKARRIENFLISHFGNLDAVARRNGIDPERARLKDAQLVRVLTLPYPQGMSEQPIMSTPSPRPSDLDGSHGRLRETVNASAIDAQNDLHAMQTWLALKTANATIKLYEREVLRLIAWSIDQKRKAMSSLSMEDAIDYRKYLESPPIEAQVKKGPKKGYKLARQFEVSNFSIKVAGFTKDYLSRSSVKKSLVIVSGFFNWLVSVKYITANPFAGIKPTHILPGVGERSTDSSDLSSLEDARLYKMSEIDRTLPREVMSTIWHFLDRKVEEKDIEFHERVRFIFSFASMTGLRISELAAARRDHLEYVEPLGKNDVGGWILNVVGKRMKPREVPLPDVLIDSLKRYFFHRKLTSGLNLDVPPGTFLIGSLPSKLRDKVIGDGVRPQTIHRSLKELFALVSTYCEFNDPTSLVQITRSTAHWLRHTAATNAVAAEVPLDVVAATLGHTSMATTSRYVRAGRSRKIAEMQRIWKDSQPCPSI